MTAKIFTIPLPNTIIRCPSFRTKNHKVRHIVKIPYFLPVWSLTINKSENEYSRHWNVDFGWQLPDYELEIY